MIHQFKTNMVKKKKIATCRINVAREHIPLRTIQTRLGSGTMAAAKPEVVECDAKIRRFSTVVCQFNFARARKLNI